MSSSLFVSRDDKITTTPSIDSFTPPIHLIWDVVATDSPVDWRETAHLAIRRIRSFEKRGLADRDHATQVRDIAKYFVDQFEDDPKLVGAQIRDYEELAERVMEVVAAAESNKPSGP